MRTYRKYNWPELITSFEQPGLSQAQFCAQQNINPKYFSQKRLLLLGAHTSRFDKVDTPSANPSIGNLTIHIGRCHIHCPNEMSLTAFANLIDHLA